MHNGISFICKEKWNNTICKKMNGTGKYTERSNPGLNGITICSNSYADPHYEFLVYSWSAWKCQEGQKGPLQKGNRKNTGKIKVEKGKIR